MKLKSLILCGIVGILTLTGCKKNNFKSLSDMKKEQTHAINQISSSKGLHIVEAPLPDNPDPQTYYKLDNGLYLRVLSRGQNRPTNMDSSRQRITIQIKGYSFADGKSQISSFDNYSKPDTQPIEFIYVNEYGQYGALHYHQLSQLTSAPTLDNLMCEGLAFPMSKFGDEARVSLIIPFELGPTQSYSTGYTLFIEEALYSFVK